MIIATLIAAQSLNADSIDDALALLADKGLSAHDQQWLEMGRVLDLAIAAPSVDGVRAALAPLAQRIDIVVQPVDARAKKLLVSDMDSTMIAAECIDELADFAGIKAEIAAITERAMQGELDFEAALRERVALLAGLDEAAIGQCLDERIRPMPGAATLIATLKARGVRTVLVSGGFHHFADVIGAQLGFDHVVANRLDVKDGKLTGRLNGPVVDAAAKARLLLAEAQALALDPSDALALGDGANDIPMLQAAGLGLAYHAKAAAAAAADGHIAQDDLTAVLHAQGIARDDWVVRD